ncbi:vacuolar protein sorting-associated protein 13C isoform X5 [Carcharodon carcharias]|uniref:vacuolar protein sorting-associated protein 13C isoform X5 n=1 Tax=Carcharodon carcharias TaxID=13397 RepID=UPI001B7DE618|nr:vacuolar protein sorting-associated protein 13C isoform X5 [Carcharodon carcharias]
MVFEALVAELLNRGLGDYVENLDKSQLKLGIWGGNVVLENLKVKENALNDLDVPFKVKAGQIDKLTLKIPWKNLYSEAVLATLDGLNLLVVPEASIKYDAEKEEKQLQENKQKELLRIEDALQKAAKKGASSGEFLFALESYVYKDVKPGRKHKKSKKYFKKSAKARSKGKPKEEKKDSFAEKLATQIIKNLQVKITSIHVRYEDAITDSSRPISVGVTLGELSLQTADENWTPCILTDTAKIIYKLVRLDCLCAYWNVNSSLFCQNSREQILVKLKEGIASSAHEPKNHDYIFKPISASAKLCINPYAETELNSPKINLDMEVHSIDIEMTKPQYLSIIDLLESVDYMVRNVPYRKYKPDVPLQKNAIKWWQYAITGILEVHVRRKYHMWSWANIKSHRQNLKAYKAAYKSKLTQTKLSEELLKQLQILEKSLDIFNITLARQQAHVEVIRSGHKMLGKKGSEKQSGGWFSGLWGRKESKKKGEEEEKSVPESINDLMTGEEKTKLYTAIGYSESSHNLTLPKEYVAHVISFKLVTTSITIREEPNVPEILNVQVIDLSVSMFQRPGAKGLKVEARLDHWYVTGLKQQNTVPSLMASVGGTESSLLSVCFEINPEGSNADQFLAVRSQPVELIYDAQTINSLVEFFQTNRGLDLEQLTSATLLKLEEIKEKTATGLSYIIETRKTFDLRINIKPSYLVVPQTGFYDMNSDLLIVDFGSLQLNSISHNDEKATSPSYSLEEILERAYEKFDVELRSVQLLFSKPGQDWKSAQKQCSSSQHILQPMDIKVQLSRAIVEKDTRIPKFKVSGELPLLHVRMSDQKIRSVCELADSIPFPQSSLSSRSPIKAKMSLAKPRKEFDPHLVAVGSSASLEANDSSSLESDEFCDAKEEVDLPTKLAMAAGVAQPSQIQKDDESLHEELTALQLKFEVKEVVIELTRQEDQEKPLLVFSISQLGTEVNIRTFDLTSTSYLKKITLDYCEFPDDQNQKLHLISCADTPGSDLLKVEYIKADKNGPHFKMNYNSTEQMLKVAFSSLNLLLHTQALLSTINFLTTVVPSGNMDSIDKDHEVKAQKQKQDKGVATKTVLKSSRDTDVVVFKMFAMMDAFNVAVCDEKCSIADIRVQGLDASASVQSKQMEVSASLRDIVVTDVDSKTLHKKAVSIVGNEVFSFNVTLYPNAIDGEDYTDMSKVDGKVTLRVGCIQIIYLHKFVMSLLDFFDNFQAAKEALSAATAQAAEKAASSVKDFAQKSFRLAMDINLKAPVIIIPESSISMNALVADLGLITVQNRFTLILDEGFLVPPVMDIMDVHLTQLKLSRTILQTSSSQLDIQMLQPIDLHLTVQRNLAAAWYLKIPSVEIKGHLKTMNIVLSEEDLTVLMKVFQQNLGEGSKKPSAAKALKDEGKKKLKDPKEAAKTEKIVANESSAAGHLLEIMKGVPNDSVDVQLNFEIKEVVVELTKQINKQKSSFLVFHVVQLGSETKVRKYDLTATAYLKKISLNCCEFQDSNNLPLNLISSSDKPGADLLKVEYIKADRNGPHFKSTYDSTEQKLRVAFSSLDLILHSQALLSTMNFMAAVFPSGDIDKDREAKPSTDHAKETSIKAVPVDTAVDVFDLKFSVELGALNIFVCDKNFSIADIKIQGMDASVSVHPKQTEGFARLRDIIVTDVVSRTLHKKVVSIIGEEVFSFKMVLCSNATEGADYLDMSKVDGEVTLQVGCIQLVYLHKFFMSLLNFFDNFQAAKEALSAATAQAAEKAASSVKDFAQKSFRLAMDINLKAPVIIIPESSISMNALVADLGLITVQNKFTLISAEECTLPPVVDIMEVQLTQLKLSRTVLQQDSAQPDFQMLQPVNMLLMIKRNLAVAWYHKIPGIEINGDLKAMNVTVSQDDLTILLKILLENFGEAISDQGDAAKPKDSDKIKTKIVAPGANLCEDCPQLKTSDMTHGESENKAEPYETLKFDLKFESLSIVLYTKDHKQPTDQLQRLESSRLGEFRLHLTTASGMMFTNGSLSFDMNLTTCTLDDLREGIEKVTQRMIEKKQGAQENVMIELQYNQTEDEMSIVAVLEHLYLCASVEFLLDVADFFIKAMPEKSADKSVPLYLKQTGKASHNNDTPRRKVNVKVLVMNPEVVFVANLSKADAPALVASFHCDTSVIYEKNSQRIIALVSDLKVLACPFLREKRGTNITTVLQPCSLYLDFLEPSCGPQNISLKVEEIIVKISPITLNTVMTIMSAMTPKVQEIEMQQTTDMVTDLWAVKDAFNSNYWFLGVDMASEATEIFTEEKREKTGESFKIDVSLIQVTLECGHGHCTIPLLLTESTFSGRVENWTSFVSVNSDMTLEVLYYNELSAVWEPLLEQVAGGLKRWSLTFQMKTNMGQDKALVPGDDFFLIPDPQTAITISSKDILNITVSKCSLNVLDVLAKAFSAGTASTFDYSLKDQVPYTLKNALGIPLDVHHSTSLRAIGLPPEQKLHQLDAGQILELDYLAVQPRNRGKLSVLERQESTIFTLTIVPHDYTEVANIPVAKPGRRLYNVFHPGSEHSVSLLAQIDVVEGDKRIIIRSPLQIKNHFSVSFIIYKFIPDGWQLEPIGVANPEEEFHVPLDSYRGQLFLKPSGELEDQFKMSTTYITWKEELHRSTEIRCTLQCPSTEMSFIPLIVNTIAIPDELNFISNHGDDEWDPAYIIHLHPTATIRNLLPYSLRYMLEATAEINELAEGCTADILQSRIRGEIMELVLMKYQGRNWCGHIKIEDGLAEMFPVCFTADSKDRMSIDLLVHVQKVSGRLVLSIYSPYWIINKTSRVLQYRAEDVHVKHPADFRDVVLFSFKRKNIFSKNKIQLCVSTSSWSNGFSLDTVGSYGCVKCPAKNMGYLIGVTIKMSSFNMTKVVTLTPFYTLVNKSSYELEVGEDQPIDQLDNEKWVYISAAECLPFWPETTSNKLCVRVVGSELSSKSFFYNKQDNGTLLSLDHVCGGVIVDVNVADHATVITFTDYYDGSAPALLINHTTAVKFRFKQSGLQDELILDPGQARLFAWTDPTGIRKLNWGCVWKTGELDLLKDQFGQFLWERNNQIHWVSFLDGRQRVLVFSEDVAVISKARQAEDLKQFDKGVTVSLHSLGLSLVNNESKQEIAYIGITSSGVVWEMKRKQRWRPFSQKHINLLEENYQTHLTAKTPECWIKLNSNLEVNFQTMQTRLPQRMSIRRNFLSGIQVEYKQSAHHRSLRAQLYWLQVDNQLAGAIFPIAFHPVPPPKSIALDSEPKPFIDISIITRFNEHSQVMQFKYFMVLIQEMAVKIDQGFLSAVIAMFTPASDPLTMAQKANLIDQDMEALKAELMETSMTDASRLSFFEYFHISPIKLHLSLSLDSGGEESSKEKQEAVPLQSLHILLKSIGATLTDVDDLIFKLAFFEMKFQFYKWNQLMWAVISHYSEQFLKQMYVLVLGLDVLGNPVGLIRGLSEGVEAFFYEPFQGAVQGPEEFAEGFVIGVRSLLGHTVGGAAGVVSRITGTVGKGLAAITMDKEYQQKRREEMNRQPKDFGDSLAKGGKGFLRGVVGGFTGIVTKPVEGAKKEGAAGFFKGVGKGLVGVVARPTGGIVDMASSTLQGIRKVAESTEDVNKLRPPRCIREDGIIRPYDRTESEGCHLFEKLEFQKFEGENYRFHCRSHLKKKVNLLITNRRVVCMSDEILGHLGNDWNYTFEEFVQPPTLEGNVLSLYIKDQSIIGFSNCGTEGFVKKVIFQDTNMAKRVIDVLEEAQAARQQEQLVKRKSLRFSKP